MSSLRFVEEHPLNISCVQGLVPRWWFITFEMWLNRSIRIFSMGKSTEASAVGDRYPAVGETKPHTNWSSTSGNMSQRKRCFLELASLSCHSHSRPDWHRAYLEEGLYKLITLIRLRISGWDHPGLSVWAWHPMTMSIQSMQGEEKRS